MYVITGATGHTGNEVAEKLLAKGEGACCRPQRKATRTIRKEGR